ncbi:MAG: PAS/PAC sensor-containing diguanylate cyclase/phosphodiesterase, partial [Gallionellaceae bacterium]
RRAKVLVDASSRLAAGDYAARADLKGGDELAELSKSLDTMAQQIKEHIAAQELERERLAEAQKIGHFGSWELDLVSGKLHWSDEIFRMFEIDRSKFAASYETFLNAIHPADRERVSQAYSNSLKDRLPYQITHRLLMPDGKIKWVEERCTSYFDDGGKPLRSLGTVQDVTQRENDEQQLRIAAAAFETQEAILVTDRDCNIIRVNQSFEAITGYSFADVAGKNPRILSSGRQDQEFYRQMWAGINAEGRWSGEIWDRRKNGEIYPKWLTITSVKKDSEITHYVGVFVDISERKRAEEEIRLLAFYDPLTKLPNRRQLMERLHTALSLSQRSRQYGALMFLDLDHFKVLNDTKGHDVGDRMLVEVANRVSGCVRESDTVARLGGDEFVVLLEGLGAQEEEAFTRAAHVAEKIRTSLTLPYDLNGYLYESSPSIGVALFLGNDIGIDDLLKRADLAMYQSKETGRNAFRFFEPRMQATLEARSQMEYALRHALDNGELTLHYQLQTNRSKELLGAEVLLRWDNPGLGRVSPAQFIPLAEQTRLILPIGCWVLETACQKLKEWERHPLASRLYLAVNISPIQFHQPDFVSTVKTVLGRTAISPARLELELTENLVLENVEVAIEKITALREVGVRFSMDDFGTGYSSLQFIKRLPINTLKIDQSFVRDILTDPGDAVMVQTIAGLAHNFGFDVIAEGVETEAQLSPLIERGCATFQGYLFSKPVPMEEFERLIEKWEQREPQ